MTKLNQKLTKHSLKTLKVWHLHGGKHLRKNFGVKEGVGCLLKGGVFSGTYSTDSLEVRMSTHWVCQGTADCVVVEPAEQLYSPLKKSDITSYEHHMITCIPLLYPILRH